MRLPRHRQQRLQVDVCGPCRSRRADAGISWSTGFSELGPHLLETSIGDMNRRYLLWVSMSASPLYGFFGGADEFTGGLLVLFRRTTLLGSLIVIGVMSNVVLLNFGYDICGPTANPSRSSTPTTRTIGCWSSAIERRAFS